MRRHEVPVAATGILREFAQQGMLRPADFHLARRMAQLTQETDPSVELAFALTVRELRLGSICLDLATAHTLLPDAEVDDGSAAEAVALPWPEPGAWLEAVAASPTVAGPADPHRPFRLVGSLLYLDRFWAEERTVEQHLRRRSALDAPTLATPPVRLGSDADQDDAVEAAAAHLTTVITGGPGTGKTTTVARILDALSADGTSPLVALAAPTGKAATRLQSAVAATLQHPERVRIVASTLHKLLGAVPGKAHPTHGPDNPLPHDVVIVDETSMVSLSMMAWLLAAVPDTARLVLIGDPHQLASVEAGAVLADIAGSPDLLASATGPTVIRLGTNHRSEQGITTFAEAIHAGDLAGCRALLTAGGAVTLTPYTGAESLDHYPLLAADLLGTASAVREAAAAGDGVRAVHALEQHRILCAHREGAFGTSRWSAMARAHLSELLPDYGGDRATYVGQPLLITRNSDLVSNGDTAVVIQRDERLVACVDRAEGPLFRDPLLLEDRAELHAMTIHKSQGSQFDTVSVVLPPLGSPLATRELVYTAVTRARHGVRLYGSLEALEAAIATPARRASGLGR